MIRKAILSVIVLLAGLYAQAQNIVGNVVDSRTGEPIIGAALVVKNNAADGTVTDINGNFKLKVSKTPATVVVSYTGYSNTDFEVYEVSSEPITVQLHEDFNQLNEVVVSGVASTVKRANLANAVSTISAKDLTGTITPQTIDDGLFGKVAGANIRANSGAPGGGVSIQLRGISSLQGASQPLYILDGVYISNDVLPSGRSVLTAGEDAGQDDAANRLADINPEDIASIEVLKGPSASAIYGTRANAGVIIITTKKRTSRQDENKIIPGLGVEPTEEKGWRSRLG